MGRIAWLLIGVVLGAAGTFTSMKYHIVHAKDGVHMVPKATAELSFPYVDIREYGLEDWNQNRELALAIVQAEKSELLEDAAVGNIRDAMENVISNLRSNLETPTRR